MYCILLAIRLPFVNELEVSEVIPTPWRESTRWWSRGVFRMREMGPGSLVSDRPLHTNIWHRFPPAYLLSASSHQVSVPRYQLITYGRRAFSVAEATVWNSLPEDMWDPECSVDSYRQSLKTFLFSQY